MLDLETVLLEFALSFASNPQPENSTPIEITMALNKRIREFAAKHKQKPDLLTRYQHAIDNEQYEVAHILKNQIMEIIKQNHELRTGHTN